MTTTALKPTLNQRLARLVSATIHPIVLPLLTLFVLSYRAGHGTLAGVPMGALARALAVVGVGTVVTAAPVAALVGFQVLSGRWSDTDVSVRQHRYLLYPFGIACMLLAAALFMALGAPAVAIQATLALALTNLINGFINLREKVSAHAATAALCAALLWLMPAATLGTMYIAVGATAAALLVGWSRVALGRHTVPQVLLGWMVGALAAVAIHAPALLASLSGR
ncbi:MAG TPA: phosphatase PAP2 family protein [Ktedonobacterales bacterium]|nr:phosphatase PAP2 family protein [Ktedonobacterales bacterium]